MTELAVVLPVIMVVAFGSLEICQRLLLKQSATVAAYESARLAARRTVTAQRAQQRGQSILQGRQITGGAVTITPANLENVATGQVLEVEVSVPISGNTIINYVLPVSGAIRVHAFMMRE